MNYVNILTASGVLAIMGTAFGLMLAYASKKFAVAVDERIPLVREALPGANCGACGFPGCDGYAAAVVSGKAKTNGCPVGGAKVAEAVSKIMGVQAESTRKMVAKVRCNAKCFNKYEYSGYASCTAANALSGGPLSCSYGCMGLGTCVQVCAFDALHINENGVAEVDKEKCTACNRCVEACPKGLISLIPYDQITVVQCRNIEIGGHVKKNCDNACIACRICEKNCPHDAIHVENNVAVVDFEKCVNCGICVSKCPTKAIAGRLPQGDNDPDKKQAQTSGEQTKTDESGAAAA